MNLVNPVVTADDVVRELRQVYDPEIGIDIVALGLLYEVAIEGETVQVWMTLTTPECPVGPFIEAAVHRALDNLPLIRKVEITFVWDPPWEWSMMSPEAKVSLGLTIDDIDK